MHRKSMQQSFTEQSATMQKVVKQLYSDQITDKLDSLYYISCQSLHSGIE